MSQDFNGHFARLRTRPMTIVYLNTQFLTPVSANLNRRSTYTYVPIRKKEGGRVSDTPKEIEGEMVLESAQLSFHRILGSPGFARFRRGWDLFLMAFGNDKTAVARYQRL